LAFGPVLSTVSLAVAPIVQRGGLPTIFTQSVAAGVNAGAYTYNVTPSPSTYIDRTLGAYLKAKGASSVAFIYDTDNPSAVSVSQTLIDFCTQNGIKTTSAGDVTSTTTDFTETATKIASAKPTAVFLLLLGSQNVTVIRQLRADGFTGQITGEIGLSGGVLTPLGSSANGIVYSSDYSAAAPGSVNKTFTSLYAKMYGAGQPSNYAADGYNAVWFAARALKAANSTDRSKVLAALQSVARTGFASPAGTITFTDRLAQEPGVLVEWLNGKETLATTP
jgi:branched-chain amino acid transport system substrate-binding protein